MTKEEAKEIIESECYVFNPLNFDRTTKINTALDVAVEALEQKPCNDAISKASVFEIMGNLMSIPYDFDRPINKDDVSESMDAIRALPSVTPTKCIATVKFSKEDMQEIVEKKVKELTGERKKGHWINTNDYLTTAYGTIDYIKCSCCGKESLEEGDYYYCPYCGAKMDEESEEIT